MDLKERETARFRLLKSVYERSGGDSDKLYELRALLEGSGLDEEQAILSAQYLAKEGLLDSRFDTHSGITHA